MTAVIAVLIEQRDRALSEAAQLTTRATQERVALAAEHDRFASELMSEYSSKLAEQEQRFKQAWDTRERQHALQPATHAEAQPATGESSAGREQVQNLRRLLEAAYADLDQLRAALPRIEEERDVALRDADDARIRFYGELEHARDEANAMQAQLDDANRQVEEARDQAREEAFALSERLSEVERELDERRAEVERMRERMAAMAMEVKHSRPPPPAGAEELARARDEVQGLRKELIDTKRQLSKVTREFAVSKIQRSRVQQPLAAGVKSPVVPIQVAATLPVVAARPRMDTPVGLGEETQPEDKR
jgi:chromosome segregation ATPase